MASMIDAFRDAFSEDFWYVKFIIFAIPVYIVANFYMIGNMAMFQFWAPILGIFLFGLFTQAIYNVRTNKREVLSFNPVSYILGMVKSLIVLVPMFLIFGSIAIYLTKYNFPITNVPYFNESYHFIVWLLCGAIVLTSYLSFAKFQSIKQGFNFKVIFESCPDVLFHLIFLMIQLAIVNALLVGPCVYLYNLFNIKYEHWSFVVLCSIIFVANISILANYMAQAATELVKGDDSEYNEISTLNDMTGDTVDIDTTKMKK